jgi:two-component system OmpR family sensor kinase
VSAPIRVRMTAWYVAVLAVVLVAVGAFVIVRLKSDLIDATDRSLRPAVQQIAAGYRVEGVPEFRDTSNTVLSGERAASQVLDPAGRVVASFGDPVSRRPMRGSGTTVNLDGTDFRVWSQPVVTRGGQRRTVVAASSLEPVNRSVHRVLMLLLIALPMALVLAAAAGWWLARRALAPIERMTSKAEGIGPDALDERVDVPATADEVAHLATTLNTMLDRIQAGAEDQRRLVADTSHELRTPLTAMRAELDVSLRHDDLTPAARTVLESTREEVDRISATVDDLLVLARADEVGLVAVHEHVDLHELAAAATAPFETLASARGVELRLEGQPAPALGDPDSLRHALRNLVDNAVKFTPGGGAVVVRSRRHDGVAEVAVIDEGPGIPADLQARVFDRFFRIEEARTGAGSGLGLAIVDEVARAHGGHVGVAPHMPCGSVFTFTVPSDATPGTVPGVAR